MSADNWQKGDLALCVNTRPSSRWQNRRGPKSGQVATVESVTFGKTRMGLVLVEFPTSNRYGWSASRFRKITPPKADEYDRETIDLMRSKRVPAGEPA